MRRYLLLTLLCSSFMAMKTNAQQEVPPKKDFQFEISVSQLKKQEQVDKVIEAFSIIGGVENLDFQLIEYEIRFNCTNHDLKKHEILDRLKAILAGQGIQIEHVQRKNLSK